MSAKLSKTPYTDAVEAAGITGFANRQGLFVLELLDRNHVPTTRNQVRKHPVVQFANGLYETYHACGVEPNKAAIAQRAMNFFMYLGYDTVYSEELYSDYSA